MSAASDPAATATRAGTTHRTLVSTKTCSASMGRERRSSWRAPPSHTSLWKGTLLAHSGSHWIFQKDALESRLDSMPSALILSAAMSLNTVHAAPCLSLQVLKGIPVCSGDPSLLILITAPADG